MGTFPFNGLPFILILDNANCPLGSRAHLKLLVLGSLFKSNILYLKDGEGTIGSGAPG